MICNRDSLIALAPIKGMARMKHAHGGVSHGLGEAGYDIRIKQEVRFTPHAKEGPLVRVYQDADNNSLGLGRFAIAEGHLTM